MSHSHGPDCDAVCSIKATVDRDWVPSPDDINTRVTDLRLKITPATPDNQHQGQI